jgi:hypothetical protein|tara:strand:- start:1120 stop:1542 length:423 start_codon:yes stop_codon:yes gene_type:complete
LYLLVAQLAQLSCWSVSRRLPNVAPDDGFFLQDTLNIEFIKPLSINLLLLSALVSYLLLMIRILTIALAFLAITVLLASSFATLFPDNDAIDNSADDSVLEDPAPVQNASNKFVDDGAHSNSQKGFSAVSRGLAEPSQAM